MQKGTSVVGLSSLVKSQFRFFFRNCLLWPLRFFVFWVIKGSRTFLDEAVRACLAVYSKGFSKSV